MAAWRAGAFSHARPRSAPSPATAHALRASGTFVRRERCDPLKSERKGELLEPLTRLGSRGKSCISLAGLAGAGRTRRGTRGSLAVTPFLGAAEARLPTTPQHAEPLREWPQAAPGDGLLPALLPPSAESGDGDEEEAEEGGRGSGGPGGARRKRPPRRPSAVPTLADARCRMPGCQPTSWTGAQGGLPLEARPSPAPAAQRTTSDPGARRRGSQLGLPLRGGLRGTRVETCGSDVFTPPSRAAGCALSTSARLCSCCPA